MQRNFSCCFKGDRDGGCEDVCEDNRLHPRITDEHIPEIAKKVGEMGAYTFNVIPLIPLYKFADITPPTMKEKREMQDRCAPYIKQMRHCARCRADAIGKLGQDVQSCIYQDQKEE